MQLLSVRPPSIVVHPPPPHPPYRTSSVKVSMFGCWRGLRSTLVSLFQTQQLWLNESIPVITLCPSLSRFHRHLHIDHMTNCRQGIHWVLMVRHTRMQQRRLSLRHLREVVGKLPSSVLTAYVYHGKAVTYRFTPVIPGETSRAHRHIYWTFFLSLAEERSRPPRNLVGFISRAGGVWNRKRGTLI